jgi:hypothetical protein
MTIPEQPPLAGAESEPANEKDPRAIFAIASLIIGILDLPAMICGLFSAMAGGMGSASAPEFQTTGMIMMLVSIAAPLLLCLAGIVTGILGLRSKRRVPAIIGIVLSGLFLLLPCIFLVLPIVFRSSIQFG